MKPQEYRSGRSRGFSLVEVLVALAVIAVGMLGIAKMHALALESTSSAGTRALVAIETAGMAAAMHADRNYWNNLGSGSLISTASFVGPGSPPTVSISGSDTCTQTMTSASTCSAQDIAAYDFLNYATALQQVVPFGNVTIACQNATLPLSCTITVTWLEEAPGLSSNSSAVLGSGVVATASSPATTGLLQQPQYTLYLEP